jgi:hypothetical protein
MQYSKVVMAVPLDAVAVNVVPDSVYVPDSLVALGVGKIVHVQAAAPEQLSDCRPGPSMGAIIPATVDVRSAQVIPEGTHDAGKPISNEPAAVVAVV